MTRMRPLGSVVIAAGKWRDVSSSGRWVALVATLLRCPRSTAEGGRGSLTCDGSSSSALGIVVGLWPGDFRVTFTSPRLGARMSTEATLSRHFQAFSKDVDALMADYTPDSILFTPNGALRGLEAIRGFFSDVLRTSPPELIPAMTPIRQDIDGDFAYILWKAEPFISL